MKTNIPPPQKTQDCRIQVSILCFLFFNTFTPLLWRGAGGEVYAQKWDKIQPNILYAQDKNQNVTSVKVGIGTKTPAAMLDVAGRTRTRGNALFDSLLTALRVQCGTLNVSGISRFSGLANYTADLSSLYTNRSLVDKGWVESRNYLTGNQNIILSGDVSGSGTTSIPNTVNWANGVPAYDARYLKLSGGTLSGSLTLNADPSNPLEAATKQYVDTKVANIPLNPWTASGANISFSGGNVGINTISPTEPLTIGNTGTAWNYEQVAFSIKDNSSNAYSLAYLPNGATPGGSGAKMIIGWGLDPSLYEATFDLGDYANIGRDVQGGIFFSTRPNGSFEKRMQILQNGKVGIGTLTPSEKLTVSGTIYSSTGGFKFPDGTVQTSAGISNGSTPIFDNIVVQKKISVGTGTLILENDPSGSGLHNSIYTDAAGSGTTDLLIQSNPAYSHHTLLNANNTGNVGIGTSAPQYKLDITGNFHVSNASGLSGLVVKTDAPAEPNVTPALETKVGIGTENPIRALHIYTEHISPDAPPCTTCTESHNGMRLEDFSGSATPIRTIWDVMPLNGSLLFSKGNSNDEHAVDAKMMILENGNVGIGTLTPNEKLEVNGNAIISGGLNPNQDLIIAANSGNVGIGTIPNTLSNTNGNYKLDINGDVRFMAGGGNVVIKTEAGVAGGNSDTKVGIGTEAPIRSLHIYTSHSSDLPPPPCPNNDPDCIPSQGSHNGMRLEDLNQIGNAAPTRSIWDVAPIPGKLIIGTGNLSDQSIAAKMTLLNNGNVGIGTTTPGAKLEVEGSISILSPTPGPGAGDVSLFFGRENVVTTTGILGEWGMQYVANVNPGGTGGLNFWKPAGSTGTSPGNGFGNNFLFLADDGKVGVGTGAPLEKLSVNGNIRIGPDPLGNSKYMILGEQSIDARDVPGHSIPLLLSYHSQAGVLIGNPAITTSDANLLVAGNTYSRKIIVGDGKSILAGNLHDDFLLAVNGKMVAKSAYVTMTGWGDFVFDKKYKRMSFEDQLKYYPQYKRLHGMPSADQIEKEGLNTGETLKALTINVEETKLDVLDLYKEIQLLKKENTALKEELSDIKKKK